MRKRMDDECVAECTPSCVKECKLGDKLKCQEKCNTRCEDDCYIDDFGRAGPEEDAGGEAPARDGMGGGEEAGGHSRLKGDDGHDAHEVEGGVRGRGPSATALGDALGECMGRCSGEAKNFVIFSAIFQSF